MVRVVEPMRLPSVGLLPGSVRAELGAQAAMLEQARVRIARRDVERGAQWLERAGWRARGVLRSGVPLAELLRAAQAARADLLVLGARGTGGISRFLLGSVADAATTRAPISVLIVK